MKKNLNIPKAGSKANQTAKVPSHIKTSKTNSQKPVIKQRQVQNQITKAETFDKVYYIVKQDTKNSQSEKIMTEEDFSSYDEFISDSSIDDDIYDYDSEESEFAPKRKEQQIKKRQQQPQRSPRPQGKKIDSQNNDNQVPHQQNQQRRQSSRGSNAQSAKSRRSARNRSQQGGQQAPPQNPQNHQLTQRESNQRQPVSQQTPRKKSRVRHPKQKQMIPRSKETKGNQNSDPEMTQKSKEYKDEDWGIEERKSLETNDLEIEYLFLLLQSEKNRDFFYMPNYFYNQADYRKHVLPLYLNECIVQIKRNCDTFYESFQQQRTPTPLRYLFKINKDKSIIRKCIVLDAHERDYGVHTRGGNTWKNIFFNEYMDFKTSSKYIVQLILPSTKKGGQIYLIGVLKQSEKSSQACIYLTWDNNVINALQGKSIPVDRQDEDYIRQNSKLFKQEGECQNWVSNIQQSYHSYYQNKLPALIDLFQDGFLGYLNPVHRPSTFLVEFEALKNIDRSVFFNSLMDPKQMLDNPVSKGARKFNNGLKNTVDRFFRNSQINALFNKSQKEAIEDACDFTKQITIINGPPGTGKTFTSLGIMSIIFDHMKSTNQDGVILACAHSNSVINDWIRKIVRKDQPSNSSIMNIANTIINSDGKKQNVKVIRVGVSDKCDADTFNYALDIRAQRNFFKAKLTKKEIENIAQYHDNYHHYVSCFGDFKDLLDQHYSIYDFLTISHIRNRIMQINQEIMDLTFQRYNSYEEYEINKFWGFDQQGLLQEQKYEIKKYYQRMKDLLQDNLKEYEIFKEEEIQGAQIIVATLTSSVCQVLQKYLSKSKRQIQLCIIDEAPQCCETSILVPLANHEINKLVLIGDHRQLGPVIHDKNRSSRFRWDRSVYERMICSSNQVELFTLNEQYRSLPNLSAMTSRFFYNNSVRDANAVRNKDFPKYLQGLVSKEKNFILFDMLKSQEVQNKTSYENMEEAQGVVQLTMYLIQELREPDKVISIISPYRAQVNLIRMMLHQVFYQYKMEVSKYVIINTVDSFQGQENDIMIISLVRSQGIGFLNDNRRVNVATSRAQYGQFIFCNIQALFKNKLWSNMFDYLNDKKYVRPYQVSNQDYFGYFKRCFN